MQYSSMFIANVAQYGLSAGLAGHIFSCNLLHPAASALRDSVIAY